MMEYRRISNIERRTLKNINHGYTQTDTVDGWRQGVKGRIGEAGRRAETGNRGIGEGMLGLKG